MIPRRFALGLVVLCYLNAALFVCVQGQAGSSQGPTCKKEPCYLYDEQGLSGSKCVNDCQCDGSRTCTANGDACKTQGSTFGKDVSKAACETALKYCNGGTAPAQAKHRSGIGSVSLDQCKAIALGKCQADAGNPDLSPCGQAMRTGFNQCNSNTFMGFYTGEFNELCQKAVVDWAGAGFGFCTGVARPPGACAPPDPCKGVAVTIKGNREFDLFHISGTVTIRNNNGSPLQLKGQVQVEVFNSNGAAPLKTTANCGGGVRPNDQVSCGWRVSRPLISNIFNYNQMKATVFPFPNGACPSSVVGVQGAIGAAFG